MRVYATFGRHPLCQQRATEMNVRHHGEFTQKGFRQPGAAPSTITRWRRDKFNIVKNLLIVTTTFLLGYWMGMSREYVNENNGKRARIVANPKSTVSIGESSLVRESDGWYPIHVYHGKPWFEGKRRNNRKFPKGSQVKQDKIVLALTSELDSREGQQQRYFVDLAANDAELLSNSLLLEKNGWSGLCIEPNPVYWYYLAHRKCAVAAAFVGGVEDMVPVDVHLGEGIYDGAFGGIINEEMDNNEKSLTDSKQLTTERRYTVSLHTVFQKFQVPHVIDYLSLDVEGAESLVMKDFPFSEYQINLITIERPKLDLHSLLTANGLVYVMNLTTWGETLWVHNALIASGLTVDKVKGIVNGICGISCYR